MGLPRAEPKKEWHSTYYKLMKSFVNNVLELSAKTAESNNIDEAEVAKLLRDATQLNNITSNYESEVELTLGNIIANHDTLNVSKPPTAAEMYKYYQPELNTIKSEVNIHAESRDTLTSTVKQFQEKTFTSLRAIADDKSKANALLSELTSEAEVLKNKIKTLKDTERRLMDNLNKLRTSVVQAVRNTVGSAAEIKEAPRPSAERLSGKA